MLFAQHERIHRGYFGGQRANALERQQGMLQVIQHSHEQHDVESANALGREVVDVHLAVIDARSEPRAHFVEIVGCPSYRWPSHPRHGAPSRKRTSHPTCRYPARVCRADPPGLGTGRSGSSARKIAHALDPASVGKFEAVPPSFFASLLIPETNDVKGVLRCGHHQSSG